jgi:hypothetical protein
MRLLPSKKIAEDSATHRTCVLFRPPSTASVAAAAAAAAASQRTLPRVLKLETVRLALKLNTNLVDEKYKNKHPPFQSRTKLPSFFFQPFFSW